MTETAFQSLSDFIERLPSLYAHHAPTDSDYDALRSFARAEVEKRFSPGLDGAQDFAPFGNIEFPYVEMGAITSLELFGLDELIIFAFYRANRQRYRNVADIGGNIGLHSLIMCRNGFNVRTYEPDPHHFDLLQGNLTANGCDAVACHRAAVSAEAGSAEFVRVLGNTTGSHLAGAKANPYGDLERFTVDVLAFAPIAAWADLIKMDVEGEEARILTSTAAKDWATTDAMVEIGNAENAQAVYDHFQGLGVNLFAQKINWAPVTALADMPTSYRDGSLFISSKPEMPW